MSIKSRSSTLIEVPGVTGAVDRLQELGYRMRSDDFGFNDHDVDNVDGIIDAVKDLQTECGKLHEKLETETIHASILRHKLQFYPAEIKDEIKAAVNSARQSNADELNRLQNELDSINKHIDELENRHAELEKENSVLHPERDRVRQEHEEIIAQLNQRMAEKASKQIKLNETRDKLRETNQKIIDLEEGIIQLKEDLIQERAEARMEKKRLKKAVYDTTIKTREQKEVNQTKKKELDELQEKVMYSEAELDQIRESIRKYETSRTKLEKQNDSLTAQLSKELDENKDLKERGEVLTKELAEQEDAFAKRKAELEEKIKQLDAEMSKEQSRNDRLSAEKEKLDQAVWKKMEIRKIDATRVSEENEILQKAKKDLAYKAEEVARLTQENMDMDSQMSDMAETHDAIMATLSKQIAETRDQLAKERKERQELRFEQEMMESLGLTNDPQMELELQERRDSIQKGMDDLKHNTNKSLANINKLIQEGKAKHDELTQEGTHLQQAIKADDQRLQTLQSQFERMRENYLSEKDRRETEIETLQREMTVMQEAKEEKSKVVTDREPTFIELEKDFRQAEMEYDQNKKNLVALKNKKLGLDDSVKQAKNVLQKAEGPRQKLKDDIEGARNESLSHLKSNTNAMKNLEQTIFDMGCKLKAAIEENARFEDANEKIEKEIEFYHDGMDESKAVLTRLDEVIGSIKANLATCWNSDNKMNDIFTMRDQQLVSDLGELLDRSEKREEVIDKLTGRLNKELFVLAEFLDNVAKRRPKEEHTGETPLPTRPTTRGSTGNTPLPTSIRPPSRQHRHARAHPTPTTPGSSQHVPRPPVTPTGIEVTIDTSRSQPDTSRSGHSRGRHTPQNEAKKT